MSELFLNEKNVSFKLEDLHDAKYRAIGVSHHQHVRLDRIEDRILVFCSKFGLT